MHMYIYIYIYMMVIDKAQSRLLVFPSVVKLGHLCGKQMLTLCGETEYICIYIYMMVGYLCGKTDT